jgi:CBS domain-containing protein
LKPPDEVGGSATDWGKYGPRLRGGMVLLVKDIMRTEFLSVAPDQSVRRCLEQMVQRREGFALVREGERTVGIVTEWDFLERVLAPRKDPEATRIEEIASRPVRGVSLTTPTMDVVEEMSRSGIRRVVVTDGDRTVGIVTSKDVFRAFRSYVDKVSSDIARWHSMTP